MGVDAEPIEIHPYDQVWPLATIGRVMACDEPSQASIGAAVWLRPGLAVQALAVLVCLLKLLNQCRDCRALQGI